jgi:ATP-dependent Clp protease ATP-binding subunit ClpC
VFERFSERARQVVVLAQGEARDLGHDSIGTEHLLLGLLREEQGLAAHVLESLGITLDETRASVERIVGRGPASAATGQIPFTPEAKNTLELALREALRLGHNYIGTEHVLLGLVRVDEGPAKEILSELGTDAETIRNRVMEQLAPARAPRPGWRRRRRWEYLVVGVGALDDAGPLGPLGADGWELVTVVGEPGALRAVLKRPV